MKTFILSILILVCPLLANAQEIIETPAEPTEILAMPPYIDLNETSWITGKQVAALRERARRENYFGDIDEAAGYPRRFGAKKDEDYYVMQFYQQQAKDEAQRQAQAQSGHVDQMLNDALKREAEIKDKLIDLQGHYDFSKRTIKEQGIRIRYLEDIILKCKATRGRACKY